MDALEMIKKSKNYPVLSYASNECLKFQLYVYNKRRELKLTQSELAKRALTTQKIISKIENGLYEPGLYLISKIKFVLKK